MKRTVALLISLSLMAALSPESGIGSGRGTGAAVPRLRRHMRQRLISAPERAGGDKMGKLADKAVKNHKSFYSCSGAVLCAFHEPTGLSGLRNVTDLL